MSCRRQAFYLLEKRDSKNLIVIRDAGLDYQVYWSSVAPA
jgi:hypothetical protein